MEREMFQVLKADRRDVLAVRFAGSLGKVDLDRFTAWLERETEEQPDGSLLIVIDDFDGYRSFQAAIADLKADLRFKDRFTKIAVVGDAERERVMTALADPFSKASLRYYPEEQQGAALAWLRS
ncbi:STAS/SEC14 domain-containing protein [Parvularcula oceani]|uniref:STAS/SEC14 domain-containing protein n=1 Tax=Parvularcula oceani TaxID=1247963 RepID=UPI00138DD87E|nr:STAS/SEC14 domain-containing protein [Parvularcula oceani]